MKRTTFKQLLLFARKVLVMVFFSIIYSSCEEYVGNTPINESCEDINVSENQPIVQFITEDVTNVELDNILVSLFGHSISRSSGYDSEVIKDEQGKDCIIKINYKGGNGFALISATKTHEPVLAYNTTGSFEIADSLPFPLNEWYNATIEGVSNSRFLDKDSLETIAKKWKSFEPSNLISSRVHEYDYDHSQLRVLTQQQYERLNAIAQDSIRSWQKKGYRVYHIDDHPGTTTYPDMATVCDFMMGIVHPYYAEDYWAISYVVEIDIKENYGLGHCLRTKWRQEDDYNQVFPLKPENPSEKIPVGCGPLAVGQIMYAMRYPTNFNWDAMPTTSYFGNETVSTFLYDVFKKCNTKYIPYKGSACNQDDRVKALKEYGYTCRKIDGKKIDHSELMYGSPAIIASYFDNDEEDAHAWIIEGAQSTKEYIKTHIYSFPNETDFVSVFFETSYPTSISRYYVNWGWGGLYDGYYSLNCMIPSNYTNNTLKSAIVDIKPNK